MEFTILITFFLILFFCIIQICLTAIDKFHMAHYGLYSARVWSVCPCMLPGGDNIQINEALARVKLAEGIKKSDTPLLGTGRNLTEGDMWRIKYLWAVHSSAISSLGVLGLGLPDWADDSSPTPTGPVYFQPFPMRMPYSGMIMGGSINIDFSGMVPADVTSILSALGISIPPLNLDMPDVEGFKVSLGRTFVPMDREGTENPDEFDNDVSRDWTDLVATGF